MTLYEIDCDILSCIDLETGEIVDTARLDELQLARTRKVENIALLIKNCRAEEQAIVSEIKALDQRKKAKQRQIARLSEYATQALQGEKLTTARVVCSFRASTAVAVEDEKKLVEWAQQHDDSFIDYLPPKINKTRLKESLKEHSIPYASLEKRQHLTIT